MSDTSDTRESGVEFGNLADDIESEEYPIGNEELLEKYGDREIEHANGSEPLRAILGPLDDTYDSPEAVRQAVFNMIGQEAEGRVGYSDRGDEVEDANSQDQSF